MENIPSFQNLSPYFHDEQSARELRNSDRNNEEMDKIFSEGGTEDEFSLSQLTSAASATWNRGSAEILTTEKEDPRIKETDHISHHLENYPHVHSTLKPSVSHQHRHHHHRRSGRRHRTRSESRDGEDDTNNDPHLHKRKRSNSVQGDNHATAFESEPEKDSEETESETKSTTFSVGDPNLKEGWSTAPEPRSEIEQQHLAIDTGQHDFDDFSDVESSPLIIADSKLKPIIRTPQFESETDSKDQLAQKPSEGESAQKKTPRVQFDIGDDAQENESENKERHSSRRRRHKKRDPVEDPSWRRVQGSETALASLALGHLEDDEDDAALGEHDKDDISTHRFEDSSGYRRQRVRARSSVSSIVHSDGKHDQRRGSMASQSYKKHYDHSPHEVFVELEELMYVEGNLEWKETARWIKYEENIQTNSNRWGKPHLAFLNFHSLFSLRKGLDTGAVLLDLEETDLPSIAGRVVDQMIACDQIPQEQREAVIRVLLLRHRHIRDNQSSFKLPSRGSKTQLENEDKIPNNSSSQSLRGDLRASVRKAGISNLFHAHTFKRNTSAEDTQNVISNGNLKDGPEEGQPNNRKDSYTQIDMETDTGQNKDKQTKELMKKIPEGAEATAVLVGAVDFLKQPTIAFVRLAQGVVMDGLIEVPIPIRFMFVLLGPFHGEMDYHEVGRSISTLMSDKSFHEVAYRAHSRGQLLTAINEFLNASIVMPPSEWNNKDLLPIDDMRIKAQQLHLKKESLRARKKSEFVRPDVPPTAAGGDDGDGDKKRDPLVRHGKLFYGVMEDWKKRMPLYLSDIKDGLNGQTIAAAIFIYFASLSAAITFGGLYGTEVDNYIGVGETLLITSVNGLMMALCGSQPLLIVGATGPLMIFDLALYTFCKSMEIEYLPMRFWIGFWMTVFGFLVAAFELVAIVKKFTRFTEEIFSTLVCLIFIYEAFNKLSVIFKEHPLLESDGYVTEDNHTSIPETSNPSMSLESGVFENGILYNGTDINGTSIEPVAVLSPQPNTALLSLILMMGTFIIAIRLKAFRNSKFLGRPIRRALGDFGVPISIVLMVTLDYCMDDTYTDKISMTPGLSVSNPEVRGWLVNPFGNGGFPFWCIFAAAPASVLLFVLVFLEENICHLILSKPERNMVKGSGFHSDLVISCLMNLISGTFGAPFMTPAVVRTVSHTSALTVMSTNQAPGESAKIAGVLEQRVSATLVSLMVGLSVLLTPVLNLVPKPVLYGIFLYMGISSTAGIQFLERMFLFLMPVKHHPNVPYVKKLRTWKMHAFTGIQLTMIVVLWVVKQSPAALCFPFVLMCLIPLRLYLLPLIFNHDELDALDGSGAHDSAVQSHDTDDLDFFEEAHDFPTHIDDDDEDHTHIN